METISAPTRKGMIDIRIFSFHIGYPILNKRNRPKAVGFAIVLTTAHSGIPEQRPSWAVDQSTRNQNLKRVKLHFISDYGCVKPPSHISARNWLHLPGR